MLLPCASHRKAAAAGFLPSDLSGLYAWYDASDTDTITHTAGAVSQLDDKSGNARHATQAVGADQPTTGVRTVNGLNSIYGDGISKHLITPFNPSSSNGTWFCVFKSLSTFSGTNAVYGSHDNSNQRDYIVLNGSGNVVMGTGNSIFTGSTTLATDTIYTTMKRKSGANAVSLHIDGVVDIANDAHSFSGTSADPYILMARTFNVTVLEEYENDFCEWIMYNRSLSDSEANQVGNYLTRWGHSYTDIT